MSDPDNVHPLSDQRERRRTHNRQADEPKTGVPKMDSEKEITSSFNFAFAGCRELD